MLHPYLSDKPDEGKIDLFNIDYYKHIPYFRAGNKDPREKLERYFSYFKDLENLLSTNPQVILH
jgi:hypothetical protein